MSGKSATKRVNANPSTSTIFLVLAGLLVSGVVIALLASGYWYLGLVVVAVAGVGLFFGRGAIRTAWLWEAPDLVVATNGLAMGAPSEVGYTRASRRTIDVPQAHVVATLTCTETVYWEESYRDAEGDLKTSRETRSAVVYRGQFVAEATGTADGLEARIPITVPDDAGAPTLSLADNRIAWELHVELRGAGLPNDTRTFDVVVRPELLVSSGVQDR